MICRVPYVVAGEQPASCFTLWGWKEETRLKPGRSAVHHPSRGLSKFSQIVIHHQFSRVTISHECHAIEVSSALIHECAPCSCTARKSVDLAVWCARNAPTGHCLLHLRRIRGRHLLLQHEAMFHTFGNPPPHWGPGWTCKILGTDQKRETSKNVWKRESYQFWHYFIQSNYDKHFLSQRTILFPFCVCCRCFCLVYSLQTLTVSFIAPIVSLSEYSSHNLLKRSKSCWCLTEKHMTSDCWFKHVCVLCVTFSVIIYCEKSSISIIATAWNVTLTASRMSPVETPGKLMWWIKCTTDAMYPRRVWNTPFVRHRWATAFISENAHFNINFILSISDVPSVETFNLDGAAASPSTSRPGTQSTSRPGTHGSCMSGNVRLPSFWNTFTTFRTNFSVWSQNQGSKLSSVNPWISKNSEIKNKSLVGNLKCHICVVNLFVAKSSEEISGSLKDGGYLLIQGSNREGEWTFFVICLTIVDSCRQLGANSNRTVNRKVIGNHSF